MPLTFFIVMFAVTLLFFILARVAVERVERNHYRQRSDFFHHYPVNQGDIVFLGDSITDGGCWDELFPGLPIKNRGINGDTTTGVLNRIGDVLAYKPAAIFILIGTNDLPWFQYRHDDDILQTYIQILEACLRTSPETKVFVQSILPRAARFAKRIQNLNRQLKEISSIFHYTFINLYPHFEGAKGELSERFTNDHLHLLSAGYARWVEILAPFMSQFQQKRLSPIKKLLKRLSKP